jgi:A/G-specific adenine glycosylase
MIALLEEPRKVERPQELTAALLKWWDAHRRDLPWRAPAGQRADAYAAWLSEVMLQQTTVASVTGYFQKFMARWPTVQALAAAPLDEVLSAWAGLGYYARARNLHACAKVVAEQYGGRFPQRAADLLRLPGVGPYTASAIAAIAFGEPCVAQDGNVERVVTRLFAVETPLPKAKAEVARLTRAFLSLSRPGDFAQALMDLGAMICRPRAPDCACCPLSRRCVALGAGTPASFPVKSRKPRKPHRRGAAFVLRRGEHVLLCRRPAQGLLGGMCAFPTTPLHEDLAGTRQCGHAPVRAEWRPLTGAVRHVFTHFSLELTVFVANGGVEPKEGHWTPIERLADEALPTLMRKVANHAGLMQIKPWRNAAR